MGIEPTLSAWEAEVLPLNYTRAAHAGTTGEGDSRAYAGNRQRWRCAFDRLATE
jgi:hypothetical protein